ncbi:DUF1707 domain-containing protein [Streptomyces sp. NPDC059373]
MAGETSPERRDLRVSHEDRDRTVEQLRIAAGDGRLTLEELDERLERALTARTGGELDVLVTDLPAGAQVKDLVRIEVDRASTRRDGRWVVPRALEVTVVGGSVTLDLTEAVISRPTLRIAADVRHGSLVIVTRPGVEVDADDVTVTAGSVAVRTPRSADLTTSTVLRVEVSGSVRSGVLEARPARPPRRGFVAWLLRRPRPAPRG